MSDLVSQVMLLCGSIFVLLAGIGVTRMPDFYMRLSTVTKGATLGTLLLFCGVLVELYSPSVLLKLLAIQAFLLATGPVSAHTLSRAAYFQGVKLWERSVRDELKGQYDEAHHELARPESSRMLASRILREEEGGSRNEDR